MSVDENTFILNLLDTAGLEVQYFEFTSLALLFGAAGNMLLITENSVKNMEMSLLKRCVTTEERELVKKNTKKLIKMYNGISQCQFKYIQENINPCFEVFSQLLLPDNAAQCLSLTQEHTEHMDEEIEDLKSRYKRALCRVSLFSMELYEAKKLHLIEKQLFLLQKSIESIKENICDSEIAYKCISRVLKKSRRLELLLKQCKKNSI